MLNFTVITIFPSMFPSPLATGLLKKAQEKSLIAVHLVDPRNYTTDRHRTTDDYPYGGGQGMIMKPEPLTVAIEETRKTLQKPRVILLTPQGRVFNQSEAHRLAVEKDVVLVCGRYEGIDERVKAVVDDELSLGDYTLSGGEMAAMVVIEAVSRLVPGVLGNEKSPQEESFSEGLLEYPQYTRPEEYRGMKVPGVLLSGDHERIKKWRREMSLTLTHERRPDLLQNATLSREERHRWVDPRGQVYIALLHYPVYDKNRQVVTTAITNMDIHDIARSARTYGVKAFYVVNPVKPLQKLAAKIVDHWEHGYGSYYNATRKDALSTVRLKDTLDEVIIDVERQAGTKPNVIVTSARSGGQRTSFARLREVIKEEPGPFLILFGTGWGLTETIVAQADLVLEPIEAGTGYNHLSVRSAAAVILDRLLGTAKNRGEEP